LEVDTIITGIDFIEDDRKVDDQADSGVGQIAKELGSSAPISSTKVSIPVCKFKGISYLLQPKKGAGGLAYYMYLITDTDFRNVVGEVGINPATLTFNGAVPKIY
jgi:hypothetical protein